MPNKLENQEYQEWNKWPLIKFNFYRSDFFMFFYIKNWESKFDSSYFVIIMQINQLWVGNFQLENEM